jgi:hypothetical protein
MTFDVTAQVFLTEEYDWLRWYEVFSICRNCRKPTVFVVKMTVYEAREKFYKPDGVIKYEGSLNPYFQVVRFVSLRDQVPHRPPDHLPSDILEAFGEGAACLAINCNNAAACMFRLCIDIATRPLLPDPNDTSTSQPNAKQRRDLGLRLAWLFENQRLPSELRELAKCVREDANDGAHAGSLSKEDAEDLLDFTRALLERLITEPRRLELAEARRLERRKLQ